MISLYWRTDLELRHALHPAVGYDLKQNPADFRDALAEMGLADIFTEERIVHWATKYPLAAVVERMTELLSTNANIDDWEWVFWFDKWFSDTEKAHLSECIIDWLYDRVEDEQEENRLLNQKFFNSTRYWIGMTGLALAFLFSNFFDGKQNPSWEVFPPAQVEKLTDDQMEILRQQNEAFLPKSSDVISPVPSSILRVRHEDPEIVKRVRASFDALFGDHTTEL